MRQRPRGCRQNACTIQKRVTRADRSPTTFIDRRTYATTVGDSRRTAGPRTCLCSAAACFPLSLFCVAVSFLCATFRRCIDPALQSVQVHHLHAAHNSAMNVRRTLLVCCCVVLVAGAALLCVWACKTDVRAHSGLLRVSLWQFDRALAGWPRVLGAVAHAGRGQCGPQLYAHSKRRCDSHICLR